jgi:hypothetical protein
MWAKAHGFLNKSIVVLGGIMEEPVVFLHGFSGDTLLAIVGAVKKAAGDGGIDPASIAFASSTLHNMDWKIRKLIREVRREHETIMKKERAAKGG